MKQTFILLLLFIQFSVKAQIPAHYIRSYGSSGTDGGTGVCHDSNGNVYATGYFSGSMMVDSTHYLSTTGGSDIYILKNDSNGNLLWVISVGGTGFDRSSDIACDGSGNVYITGFFSGTAQFGNQTITSNGLQDFFVAKFDASGNITWVQSGGGAIQDAGKKIDIDSSGNCVVT